MLNLKAVLCNSLPGSVLLWSSCCNERQWHLWLILDPYISNRGKLGKKNKIQQFPVAMNVHVSLGTELGASVVRIIKAGHLPCSMHSKNP